MAFPRDLTNFVNAGTLNSSSRAPAQQMARQSSPQPTEEWVCIEDYYSDEEQSGVVEAAPTSSKDQLSPAASRSVCLALPSVEAAAEAADFMVGLTVSLLSAVSPASLTTVAAASKPGARPQAPSSNLLATTAALA